MNPINKALIVEDEPLARKRLKKLLLPYAAQLQLLGEAENGEEGLLMIEALKPDFVFLDIQMPVMNGFEMLLKLSYQPYLIFTTAYDDHAIRAFEENSIDYLLKPIRAERLERTMEKISKLNQSNHKPFQDQEKFQAIIDSLTPPKTINSLTVNVGDRILLIKLEQVVFFQAEDKLTNVVITSGSTYIVTHSLSQLQEKLPDYFMRVSRSFILNENEVHEIRKGFNGKLVFEMKHGAQPKITSGTAYTSLIKEKWKF
jgi:two-component system LytT family response regulator